MTKKNYELGIRNYVELCKRLKWGFSWALPKPTSFSCLDTRKRSKRKSRLNVPSRPATCARSLNVENSPSAQTVRRFSSLTFAQAGARLGA